MQVSASCQVNTFHLVNHGGGIYNNYPNQKSQRFKDNISLKYSSALEENDILFANLLANCEMLKATISDQKKNKIFPISI